MKTRSSLTFYVEICIKKITKATNRNHHKWQLACAIRNVDQVLQAKVPWL